MFRTGKRKTRVRLESQVTIEKGIPPEHQILMLSLDGIRLSELPLLSLQRFHDKLSYICKKWPLPRGHRVR